VNWSPINSALSVNILAIDPLTPSTVYAAGYGVYKSVDGGLNWSRASSGLQRTDRNFAPDSYVDVRALAIDPQNPAILYAGTGWGLFKTTDGGASWSIASEGLPVLPYGGPLLYVSRIAIDPRNTGTVYALVGAPYGDQDRTCCTQRLFKTTDAAAHWSSINPPVGSFHDRPNEIVSVTVDPKRPHTLYAAQMGRPDAPPALFKSMDEGATWFTINSAIAPSYLVIDQQAPDTMYASTFDGLAKSTDGGTSWAPASPKFSGFVGPVMIDPQDSATLYVISQSGLFKSTDAGSNWDFASIGISTLWIPTLSLDPQNSNALYAGSGWSGTVFKSEDAGANWTPLNSAIRDFYPFVLVIDPKNPRTIYAGTNAGDFGPAGTIFKSTDGGTNWAPAMTGIPTPAWGVNALAIDPISTNTLYAVVDQGIFRSTDAGTSWSAINRGLPQAYMSAIVIDPRTPTTLYATGGGEVFKSTDSGSFWGELTFPQRDASVIAIDPQNSNTIYAGGVGTLFKSTDGGMSWIASGSGLPADKNGVTAIVINPRDTNTLYLATNGSGFDSCSIPCSGFNDGVFRSIDGGTTWTDVNEGMTTTHVSSLVMDPQNPDRLYAGTQGAGVFTIDFGPGPIVTDLRFDRTSVPAGASYSVILLGSNLSSGTFFDVRVMEPGSSTSDVVLNWQKGSVASHNVPAGTDIGTWTITGIRPHEFEWDHAASFIPLSATITVSR
jgi:photosystem II stability/assembly factor-like uncharacterized protein